MSKQLLVYDVDWWILGYKARIIKDYYRDLEIISQHDMKMLIKSEGSEKINRKYDVISTLGLGIAAFLLKNNVRVDSSSVGGYNYIIKNIDTYREWCDEIIPNYEFIEKVMKRIPRLGSHNPKLTEIVKNFSPNSEVKYVRHFVDANHFKPKKKRKITENSVINIGWVGNKRRIGKNYKTLYLKIVDSLKTNNRIRFFEATKENIISIDKMPDFYNKLDLLIVTSANEGGPTPALEAYACGIPVISTNVGYVKTVADAKSKSLVLDSDDPQDFVQKINYLISNPQQYYDIKKGIRQNILNNWTVDKTIDDWITVLLKK